jgi:hypothetical protein
LRELDLDLVEKDSGRVIGILKMSRAGYELNPVSCILYVKRVALPLRNKLLISASLRPNITQHFE